MFEKRMLQLMLLYNKNELAYFKKNECNYLINYEQKQNIVEAKENNFFTFQIIKHTYTAFI